MQEHQQIQQLQNLKPSSQTRANVTSHTHVSNPVAIIQRARINPKSLTSGDILQLQRTIGNRGVGRLLSEIRSFSSLSQHTPIQRQEIPEKEKMSQRVFEEKPEESICPSCSIASIQRKEENRTGMHDNLKAGVESLSGIDMSDVRVHYNSSKPAEVGALAYTKGTDIHVAPGQERHLPHEAWHVVQQAQGRVSPTIQLKEVTLNDDVKLEEEADVMGAHLIALQRTATMKVDSLEPLTDILSQPSNLPNNTRPLQMKPWELIENSRDIPIKDGGLVDDATDYSIIRLTGHEFKGKVYSPSPVTGADKTATMVNAAATLARFSLPKQNKILSTSYLKKNKIGTGLNDSEIDGAISNSAARGNYKQNVDPFFIKIKGSYGSNELKLYYQFSTEGYGYITKIEQEGKQYEMLNARGQTALKSLQKDKLKQGLTAVPSFDKYSSAHNPDGDKLISEKASKTTSGLMLTPDDDGYDIPLSDADLYVTQSLRTLEKKSDRLDAVTKIAGEGARFQCVRNHAANLTNLSKFYTANPSHGSQLIFIYFKDLWGIWGDKFKSAYSIPNAEVDKVIKDMWMKMEKQVLFMRRTEINNHDYDLRS